MTQLKAFIVEDSPVIRENLVAALEEMAPIRVVGNAEDESAAIGWLNQRENQCDLVVVDIFLKSGSGLGVLKAAAKLPAPTKLVVLSNYATPTCAASASSSAPTGCSTSPTRSMR
jgi:DNA-binding NarL/FixJ family response regulator